MDASTKDNMDHLFCPRSGQLLEVNLAKGVLECTSSGYSKDISELSNIKVRKEIDMEDYMRRYNMAPLVQTRDLDAGKKVLQRDDTVQCPKCQFTGMDFYTKQLRSADEGQTIFYECPNCPNKWKENT